VQHTHTNATFLCFSNHSSPFRRAAPPRPEMLRASSGDASTHLKSHYLLDGASPLPALALAPKPGHKVLDMCAAPGGKTLVLAGLLFSAASPPSILECNDISEGRRGRLCAVLREHLPADLLDLSPHSRGLPLFGPLLGPPTLVGGHHPAGRGREGAGRGGVVVRAFDGSGGRWGLQVRGGVRRRGRGPPGGGWGGGCVNFDRILVDAPCSSERHFLHAWNASRRTSRKGGASKNGRAAGQEMGGWSVTRVKSDAKVQYGLLMQAVALLSSDEGRLVYSTCSIAPEENDAVVERLLRTVTCASVGGGGCFGNEVLDPLEGLRGCGIDALLEGVEMTKFGALLLPDAGFFGPLYWAVLCKRRQSPEGALGVIIAFGHSVCVCVLVRVLVLCVRA